MKRLRFSAFIVAIGLVASVLVAWVLRPAPVLVRQAVVTVGRFERTIEEDGLTRVKDRFVISAPLAGQVGRTRLQVGDPVTAGQTLSTINAQPPAMLDWRTLAGLSERAAAADAAVRGAIATRDRARAAVELARNEADRHRQLATGGFISDAALEATRLNLEERRQALVAADMALESAEHDHAAAQAALMHSRQGSEALSARAAAPLPVIAPAAGRILRIIQESEGFVPAGTPLYEIGNPDNLEIIVDVLSQDAAQIHPDLPARVAFGLDSPSHPAQVTLIAPVAHTKVSALGVEEQRVRVTLDFAPPAGLLIGDGWRVNARLIVRAEDPVLMIPNGAIIRQGELWRVFVVENGRARLRPVEVAERNNRSSWIRSGLRPGETLILYPPATLREGMRVRTQASLNTPSG
jgi:HlyD family secretion protein